MKRLREEEGEEEEEEEEEDMEAQMRREIIEAIEPEKSIYADGGAWRRGEWIGTGAHARVCVAHFPNPALSPRFVGFPSVVAVKSAERSSTELESEKKIYESLGESPFVLRYFGYDVTEARDGSENLLNVFIEYASGGTLYDFIVRSGHFGLLESQARVFTRSILGGIKHIHESGFIHCDLKPENVLLVKDGEGFVAKIGDFGSAKSVENDTDCIVGTEIFLAPESTGEGIQKEASDIWALGCVVYTMLTGTLNWEYELRIQDETGQPVAGTFSEEARDFMSKCLTRDPNERPTAEMLLGHPFLAAIQAQDEEDRGQFRQSEDEVKSFASALEPRLREAESEEEQDRGAAARERFRQSEKSKNKTLIPDGPPKAFGRSEDKDDENGDHGSKTSVAPP